MEKISPLGFMVLVQGCYPNDEKPDAEGWVRRYNMLPVPNTFPKGWVKKSDVKELIRFLENEEKCQSIVSPLSSTLPPVDDCATLNGYAVLLINSYRTGEPISLGGTYLSPKADQKEIGDIVAWWGRQ